jgi:hypothetical protein
VLLKSPPMARTWVSSAFSTLLDNFCIYAGEWEMVCWSLGLVMLIVQHPLRSVTIAPMKCSSWVPAYCSSSAKVITWASAVKLCYLSAGQGAKRLLTCDLVGFAMCTLVSFLAHVWTWHSSSTVLITWATVLQYSYECLSPKSLVWEIQPDQLLVLQNIMLGQSKVVFCALAKGLYALICRNDLMNVLDERRECVNLGT